MRYALDKDGLPRLKSGELCMGSGWVKILKALATLPDGRAESVKQLADTAERECEASWWTVYKRYRYLPSALIATRKIGARHEIRLTKAAWEIVRSGNFGKVY